MGNQKVIKFKSTRFGDLEVSSSSLINIKGGIIGFPKSEQFVLLEYNPPFSWLHSVDVADLAFVVVNGAEFGETYNFPIPFGDKDLDLQKEDEIAIINLVSVRSDPRLTTVNLKAPLIVNLRSMKGKQTILDDPRFPTRLPLWIDEDEGSQGGDKG